MTKLTSGEIAPVSGTYNVINENGTMVGTVYVKKATKYRHSIKPRSF